jgi:hypothetical protein
MVHIIHQVFVHTLLHQDVNGQGIQYKCTEDIRARVDKMFDSSNRESLNFVQRINTQNQHKRRQIEDVINRSEFYLLALTDQPYATPPDLPCKSNNLNKSRHRLSQTKQQIQFDQLKPTPSCKPEPRNCVRWKVSRNRASKPCECSHSCSWGRSSCRGRVLARSSE